MDELNVEVLPVLDEAARFIGVLNRSRLTASLILDVSNRLSQE